MTVYAGVHGGVTVLVLMVVVSLSVLVLMVVVSLSVQVVGYQTNVIVVSAMGLVLAAALLVALLGYRLLQWRRGGKGRGADSVDVLNPLRAKVLVALGAALMLVDL